MSAVSTSSPRLHRAARLEDRFIALVDRGLRRRGWVPTVIGFTGYGTPTRVRVLARVLLAPPRTGRAELRLGRGWRRFLTASAADVPVRVDVGGRTHEVRTNRGGYVDEVLEVELEPGWAEARLTVAGGSSDTTPLRVVGPTGDVGLVSDIDDTVMVTALPRPLLAAWNTFVRHETRRRAVPGMATLYDAVLRAGDDVPVVYLSTGPWNVAPVLEDFLARHGYPPGPLLMTDWGPTAEGWFRSGQQHKRHELARLVHELPQVQWLLVGDDGQHDPQLYAEAAAAHPEHVLAVAIRELSPAEQVRTHGTPEPLPQPSAPAPGHEEVRAPDGQGLLAALRARGVLASR